MRFLRSGKRGHMFHLGKHEKRLLRETIKFYPLVPATHHRLSRQGTGSKDGENQQLLEAALAEKRQENRQQVLGMLKKRWRFRKVKSGFHITLKPAEVDWLLQVLNDVRVGRWLALGEPESGAEPTVTAQNARYLLALELCGLFQSVLLAALGVSESPRWRGE